MARSLYARLAHRFGPRPTSEDRRAALKATIAASAGLLLSGPLGGLARAASRPGAGKRIVVIGGGFSGLSCAHELKAAGYDVTVLEARDRIGGRVLSFRDWVKGRTVEGGGELIGSNHPAWAAYAKQFELPWLDVTEEAEWDTPIVLAGKRLDNEAAAKLWEELDAAVAAMNEDARAINEEEPWATEGAAALDARATRSWIDAQPVSDFCKVALASQFSANNGVDVSKQSYLGNLTSVKGGGLEKYWTDSEVYRCKGGNQQLAYKLAEGIGASRIVLGLPVTAVTGRSGVTAVECADGRTLECDDVVLAVPPSVWARIAFRPGLPAGLAPQMGINVKHLAVVKGRFWRAAKINPDGLTDSDLSMTWEATLNQEGDDGPAVITSFSGGPAAEHMRALDPEKREAAYAAALETLYPGFKESFVESRFMDWPSERYTNAGYSFPAPGQVTTVGPLLKAGAAGGRLHFAGEHCCYKFVGYMEGALTSGAAVAKRLAARDGLLAK